MTAQTIVVETMCGSTEGNVAHYAEGEPRLLKIREAFLSGKRTREEVIKAVAKVVGRVRVDRDWKEVTGGLRSLDEKQEAWKAHIDANPAINKIYGNEVIIAEFVMAPEEKNG
jgi:hypothetical protein